MIKKLLAAAAVFGLSMSGAHAATMNFTGSHDSANELDYFYFQNNSTGDVQIVMDTFSDGYDADMAIWAKVAGSSVPGQPENSDWGMVKYSPGAERPAVENGSNIFGIPFRNGYIPNDILALGTSDPGEVLSGLPAGTYLISVGGDFNNPSAFLPGELMSLGFQGFEDLNTLQTFPHAYNLTITGNVSEVSQVPVPAAIWLMGSALAGLGVVRRRKLATTAV